MPDVHIALGAFTGFFAIANPISIIPIFLGLTGGESTERKREIATRAILTSFAIVALFVLLGNWIFDAFSLTIPAFEIAGGLLIFRVGYEMLQADTSGIQGANEKDRRGDIAVSPLAIPMIAGPGTIVTAMHYSTDSSLMELGIVIAAAALDFALIWLALRYSNYIQEKLGENIMTVVSKLMGLIVAVIGTHIVIQGVEGV